MEETTSVQAEVFLDAAYAIVEMTDRGIREALTADEHFQQAGFLPLLRDAGD
jgi:hypothetical protein